MNKKIFFLFSTVILFTLSSGVAFAQLSIGGTPTGFTVAPSNRLPVIEMPAVNVDSLLAEDAIDEQFKGRPYRFGFNHLVYFNTGNSGTWTNLSNGDHIWQLVVKTPGSFSINLAFTDFHLPSGAKLFIYSKNHAQVLGAFTEANNTPDKFFGTELIYGDEAVIEYYEPEVVRGQSAFTLFRITQGYKDLLKYLKSGFGTAGTCINNVNCPQYADYATQKRAVVCILSNGNALCSGSLVNNTLNDGTPYILTANHCGTADGSWVFRFNWEAPGCSDPASDPSTAQSISGAAPVAQTGISDFNLVKMTTAPPASYHPFYAGWSRSVVPATSVTGIHHPEGDIKKCSKANNAVMDTFYDAGNGVAQVWQIGLWTDGCTEPGSSGSPLFDQNKRIIGQLYGGPSDCGVASTSLRDYYGRFCVSWDSGSTPQTRLRDWLDPGNTNPLNNDGYDPYPPVDSLDAALTTILSPTGTSCGNHISAVITVQNAGTSPISSLTITFNVDGSNPVVYQWTGLLLSLLSTTINLPPVAVTSGNHNFNVVISQPNGYPDQNITNDSGQAAFVIATPSTVNPPLVEGFENSFPPASWSITTPPSGTTWEQANVGGYGLSNNSASVNEFSPSSSTAGETPGLITPAINMSAVTTPAILFFDVANAGYNPFYVDSLAVLASTDCGSTWTQLYLKGGAALATAPDDTTAFIPTSSQWRTDTIHIDSYVGQPAVEFQFQLISGYANITYIDNVNIKGSAPVTLDAGLNNITSPSANSCSTQVTPSFNLRNYGTSALTSAKIYYIYDGGTASSYTWTGNLAQGQSATVTLSPTTLPTGNHNLVIYSSSPNNGTDENHSNDTITLSFNLGQTPIVNITIHTSKCGPDTLNAAYPEATYVWSTDEYTPQIQAGTTGYYSVTVTSPSQCSETASVYVDVPSMPLAKLQLPVDSVCLPVGTVALSGGSPSGGIYSINSVTLSSFDGSQAVAGTYPVYYTYLDSSGCTISTYENLKVYNCTGIQQTENIAAIHIFPNPFSNKFTLQYALDASQNMDATLYSVEGKKLFAVLNNVFEEPGIHQVEINTQSLAGGVYILKVNEQYFKLEKLK